MSTKLDLDVFNPISNQKTHSTIIVLRDTVTENCHAFRENCHAFRLTFVQTMTRARLFCFWLNGHLKSCSCRAFWLIIEKRTACAGVSVLVYPGFKQRSYAVAHPLKDMFSFGQKPLLTFAFSAEFLSVRLRCFCGALRY